jgi:hypothetical protein
MNATATTQPKAKAGDTILTDEGETFTVTEAVIRWGVHVTHISYRVAESKGLINELWVVEVKTAEQIEIEAYVEEKQGEHEREQLAEQLSHFETNADYESEAA